jgi:hypothetical protein
MRHQVSTLRAAVMAAAGLVLAGAASGLVTVLIEGPLSRTWV